MTTTLYLSHPASLHHETAPGHPESSDRIRAVERALEDERFSILAREQAPLASEADLLRCHSRDHVERLRGLIPADGRLVEIDPDTTVSMGTWEAALRSAGGAIRAVDEVLEGRAINAFVAARPPGHHAERGRAMGFCFFNNAAIAARHAIHRHGAERVAIVDWDVHHGNGTQDIFWDDPNVLYCSTHEMPLFPHTGDMGERGEHNNIVNIPLTPGTNGRTYREIFDLMVVPRVDSFRPDLIIISAGFDAHWRDPLANINLTENDFSFATKRLLDIADRRCKGRVVSVLEGGYDLEALQRSVAVHVEALLGG
ncbi:histone deacetylase family protein [Camelimonas abortus]|uniref:Histone deacetylase family protein n=1 Tax=Camelimonas abortus TaxID=1017184 RepID=A0ABV7LE46_9HYPH